MFSEHLYVANDFYFLSDRNQILEEANQIHRERLTLERLKLDLMKRKNANQTK